MKNFTPEVTASSWARSRCEMALSRSVSPPTAFGKVSLGVKEPADDLHQLVGLAAASKRHRSES